MARTGLPRSATLAVIAGAVVLAASPPPSVSAEPRAADTVLVKVDPDGATVAKRSVREALGVAPRDVTMTRSGWRAYRVETPMTEDEARAALDGLPAAERIEIDRRVAPLAVPDDTLWPEMWGLHDIQASDAWDARGAAEPVVVAVIDTGTQTTHPDLAENIWTNPGEIAGNGIDDDANGYVDDVNGWDFKNDDNSLFDDASKDDHGTHVSGTIAAVRNNTLGVAGVTENAVIMPLKFIEDFGSTSAGIEAIEYAVDNGADVINASFGSGYSQAMCDAVASATAAGVVVVSAAGNDGIDIDADTDSPASCAALGNVTVAALDDAAGLASFSNFGAARVDLGAPGAIRPDESDPGIGIWSTVPPNGYATYQGTSMAAPHVAGAAALLLGLESTLTPAQVEARLRDTGVATASLDGVTVSGNRLNLLNLVASTPADTGRPGAPKPLQPGAGTIAGNRDVTFEWAAPTAVGAGLTGYRIALDGVTAATVAGTTTSVTLAVPDGVHSWTVSAVGAAGETTAPARAIQIDATPPAPFTLSVMGAASDPRPTVTWTATDAGTGVMSQDVTLDGAPVGGGGAELSRWQPEANLAPGSHTVSVSVTDGAGNMRVAAASFTITAPADTVAPSPAPTPVEPVPLASAVRAAPGAALIRVRPSGVSRRLLVQAYAGPRGRAVRALSRTVTLRAGASRLRVALDIGALDARGTLRVRWRRIGGPWHSRVVPPRARRSASLAADRRAGRAGVRRARGGLSVPVVAASRAWHVRVEVEQRVAGRRRVVLRRTIRQARGVRRVRVAVPRSLLRRPGAMRLRLRTGRATRTHRRAVPLRVRRSVS